MKSLLTAVLALGLMSTTALPAAAATRHHHATSHAAHHTATHHRASHATRHTASGHKRTAHGTAAHKRTSRHGASHHAATHQRTGRHTAAHRAATSRHARHTQTVGASGPHHWAKGQTVPAQYRTRAHYISYSRHHLKAPPKGYEWVQVDDNYALVSPRGVISSLAPADKY